MEPGLFLVPALMAPNGKHRNNHVEEGKILLDVQKMKKLARLKSHAMMELSSQLLEDAVDVLEVVVVVDEDVVDVDVEEEEEEEINSMKKNKRIFLIIGIHILR